MRRVNSVMIKTKILKFVRVVEEKKMKSSFNKTKFEEYFFNEQKFWFGLNITKTL